MLFGRSEGKNIRSGPAPSPPTPGKKPIKMQAHTLCSVPRAVVLLECLYTGNFPKCSLDTPWRKNQPCSRSRTPLALQSQWKIIPRFRLLLSQVIVTSINIDVPSLKLNIPSWGVALVERAANVACSEPSTQQCFNTYHRGYSNAPPGSQTPKDPGGGDLGA